MNTRVKKLLMLFLAFLVLCSLTVCVAAQAAETPEAAEEEHYAPLPLTTVPYVDNDTAVRGEYTPFEPKEEPPSRATRKKNSNRSVSPAVRSVKPNPSWSRCTASQIIPRASMPPFTASTDPTSFKYRENSRAAGFPAALRRRD